MPLEDDGWSNTGVPYDEGVNVVGAECAAEMTEVGAE